MRQIAESEGIQRRGLVLALLTRLKQVCNHPALLLHDGSPLHGRSGKLARLGEMLEEVIASGERALVFTQYAEMGRLLQDYLRETLDREVLFLHGGTPMAERDRIVSEFQTDAHGPPVFRPVAQSGRHRPEPDPRQPRLPLRSLVEPGRREPGHRSRVPHRPDAQRAGAQVRVRGHVRRDAGRPDRTQGGAGRVDRRHQRSLDHRDEHRRPARSCSACGARMRSPRTTRDDRLRLVGAPRSAPAVARHQGATPGAARSARPGGPAAGSPRSNGSSTRPAWRAVAPTRAPARSLSLDVGARRRQGRGPGQPAGAVPGVRSSSSG